MIFSIPLLPFNGKIKEKMKEEDFMQYKNIEIHNTTELITNEDGSISWIRVPKNVYDQVESDRGKRQLTQATGVELRFVINSKEAKIKMKSLATNGMVTNFHVYFGSIQGGCDAH